MTISFIAFLLGIFGIPIALLTAGHRLRRRPAHHRRAFWGAVIGHCIAGTLAVTLGMIPAEEWTAEDKVRGFIGLWAMLLLPLAGAIIGLVTGERDRAR